MVHGFFELSIRESSSKGVYTLGVKKFFRLGVTMFLSRTAEKVLDIRFY